MRKFHLLLAGLLIWSVQGGLPGARAGDGIPVPEAEPQVDAATDQGLLGQEYKDEVNGFRLQVPFGVRILQRAGGMELISFVHDAKQWIGTVELATLEKDTAVSDLLRSRSGELDKAFKDVKILDSKETINSGKPAGKLVCTFEKDYPVAVGKDGKPTKMQSIPLIRQELMIQTATNQYMVLTFFAPLPQKDDAIAVFNAMVGSFEILDRKAIEAQRLAAVKAGQDWLAHIHAEDLIDKLVREPQMFRIKIENKDIGYLRIDESADSITDDGAPKDNENKDRNEGFRGITVIANSRTFPPNGTMILGSNSAFWAYHKQGAKVGEVPSYSTWDNRSGMQIPNDPNRPTQVSKTPEIRNGQVIRGVAELPPTGVVKWDEEIGTLQLSLHPVEENKDIVMKPLYELNVVLMTNAQVASSSDQTAPLKAFIRADMPSPMPKPLEYLWPRLVDLTKESQMALLGFNSGENKLGLRKLTIGKPETITIDNTPMHVTRLTDEMGKSSTTIWVDQKGVIQMMRTSDGTVLLPTSEEEMRKLWSTSLAKFR